MFLNFHIEFVIILNIRIVLIIYCKFCIFPNFADYAKTN
jgi:hypothetical protein